jgi:hypothetical protein
MLVLAAKHIINAVDVGDEGCNPVYSNSSKEMKAKPRTKLFFTNNVRIKRRLMIGISNPLDQIGEAMFLYQQSDCHGSIRQRQRGHMRFRSADITRLDMDEREAMMPSASGVNIYKA